jgi:hypothetical protein
MKKILYLILSLTLMILSSVVFAQVENEFVPTMINYQGFLTDQTGTALSGTYQITFALYYDSTGTISNVWEEIHDAVVVESGLFNVLLGSIDTLTAADLVGERYLGIRIAGEPEMTPRMRLASAAYSLQAQNANMLDNKDSEDYVAAAGDTMSGTLTFSAVTNDITTVDNEHLILTPGGNGNVGIGTTNPQAPLDVAGGIYLHGEPPFKLQRFDIGTYQARSHPTGVSTSEWAAALVGFDAGMGDVNEGGDVTLWEVHMFIYQGTWYIRVEAPTHYNRHPDWIVDVLFIRKDLVSMVGY